MIVATDYLKCIVQVAETYKAEVNYEAGVYQIDARIGEAGKIADQIREALPDVNLDIKVYPDGLLEVEIGG